MVHWRLHCSYNIGPCFYFPNSDVFCCFTLLSRYFYLYFCLWSYSQFGNYSDDFKLNAGWLIRNLITIFKMCFSRLNKLFRSCINTRTKHAFQLPKWACVPVAEMSNQMFIGFQFFYKFYEKSKISTRNLSTLRNGSWLHSPFLRNKNETTVCISKISRYQESKE